MNKVDLWFVASEESSKPHSVQVADSGRITCNERCICWARHNICSHSIAVAEKSGMLPKYLQWFRNRRQELYPKWLKLEPQMYWTEKIKGPKEGKGDPCETSQQPGFRQDVRSKIEFWLTVKRITSCQTQLVVSYQWKQWPWEQHQSTAAQLRYPRMYPNWITSPSLLLLYCFHSH